MSVLVIQTAFLGDVVLTTPLLEELAQRHGPVDVITTPAAAALVETHPAVRQVHRYDKRGKDRGPRAFLRLAGMLRDAGYSSVYLPHQSWRSGMLAMLSRIPERVGFDSAPARRCYTQTAGRNEGLHETGRLLALTGIQAERLPSLGITADDHSAAEQWMAATGVAEQFVAIAPGSVWATKRWGGYADLAGRIESPVVVVGGPEDRALGDEICAAAPDRSWNAAGILSLRASAALLSRAAALVTNDSLPLHMAQATRTPTVAIFGPTANSMGFGPRGPMDRVVELESLHCRPCSPHGPKKCPLGHHRCMVDLGSRVVADALESILSK
jgi:heptosyltransferase-2